MRRSLSPSWSHALSIEADAGVDSGSNETNAVGFLGNTDVVTADAED